MKAIIRDPSFLMPDYLPERLPHREGEIERLAKALRPLISGNFGENAFLYGPPGTGKTSVAKYVLRELENSSERVKCVYVNCWYSETKQAVLFKIASALKLIVARRGISSEELLERIIEALEKKGLGLALVLDEVDALRSEKALYDFVRLPESFGIKMSLVSITNSPLFLERLDPRILSSLMQVEVEFRPYNSDQIKDILAERVKLAFFDFPSEEVLDFVACEASARNGDVRFALSLLLKAAKIAEERDEILKVEHVKTALERMVDIKKLRVRDKLDGEDRSILLAIVSLRRRGELATSGKVYEEYKRTSKNPLAERTFRLRLEKLENLGVIRSRIENLGRGRTRVMDLALPENFLLGGE